MTFNNNSKLFLAIDFNLDFEFTEKDVDDITKKLFRTRVAIADSELSVDNYLKGCLPQIRSILERLKRDKQVPFELPTNAMIGINTKEQKIQYYTEILKYLTKKLKVEVRIES